jgi:hypothetical protein
MYKAMGTNNEMEEVLEALAGYLEALDHIEILYSRKRDYLVLRWEKLLGNYYGIDSVKDPDELALYIYGELIDRITVETKSDHNLKNMDFTDLELEEAEVITKKFISILPEKVRARMNEMVDPDSCLLPFIGDTVESLLG